MKEEGTKNIIFLLYMLVVLTLAVIYFTVPEKALFIKNEIKWWKEFWVAVTTFFK